MFVIGNEPEAYVRLVAFLDLARIGTMARAIMLNPLHKALPRMVVLFCPTCNSLSADDYVLRQWSTLHALFKKHFARLRMVLVGHSSDGDRRILDS